MRFKDTIKLAKKALKLAKSNPMLYTNEEVHYMKISLRAAKASLKRKRDLKRKGFKNEKSTVSATSNSDSRSGENNGLRSESKQPKQSG